MIYIIQRELQHYRIPFYRELSRHCEIEILYSRLGNSMSSKQNIPIGDIVKANIFKRVKGIFPTSNPYLSLLATTLEIIRNRPEIIIHEMSLSILNVYFTPLLAKLIGIKLIWWGHGYNRCDKEGRNLIKRKIRIKLHSLADASLTYSEKGKRFLAANGIKPEKVFVAWNSIDTEGIDKEKEKASPAAPGRGKGIAFLFMGRLTEGKKPLFAAELFKRLAINHAECRFHFVGGGRQEKELRSYFPAGVYKNVFIHGELTDQIAICNILQYCDILVSPGYLGLNIVHALAFGIPVLSVSDGTGKVFHSPEFEYIENTDAFIKAKSLNVRAFEDCCIRYIENEELLRKAKRSAEECYRNISMHRMIEGFMCAIK